MKNLIVKTLIGVALASISQAQDKNEPKLFGGWNLKEFTIVAEDGTSTQFCSGANGTLIYDRTGSVSVAINCPVNEQDSLGYGGLLFYSGSFQIQGNTIIHKIENSSRESLIGVNVNRTVESLTNADLVLTGNLGEKRLRIEWSRKAIAPELSPANEIAVLTYLKLKPGTEGQFMTEFQKIITPSLSEPGNVAWFVQQADNDPTNIVFYTRWLNADALNSHLQSAPLAQYIKNTAPMLASGYPQLVKFHPIDQQEK